jgi:heterodisulfide reductase subunit D
VAECHDLIAQHSLDVVVARNVIAKGMLGDQPLPLK